jgi:hypothetical protein
LFKTPEFIPFFHPWGRGEINTIPGEIKKMSLTQSKEPGKIISTLMRKFISGREIKFGGKFVLKGKLASYSTTLKLFPIKKLQENSGSNFSK